MAGLLVLVRHRLRAPLQTGGRRLAPWLGLSTYVPITLRSYRDTGLSPIDGCRFAADLCDSLNAPQRPSQPPQGDVYGRFCVIPEVVAAVENNASSQGSVMELGVREPLANTTAGSGRGAWYLAKAKALSVGAL
jgi:hypothetical protein